MKEVYPIELPSLSPSSVFARSHRVLGFQDKAKRGSIPTIVDNTAKDILGWMNTAQMGLQTRTAMATDN
jgi:hypothetical protein